jgi:ABC-2 type transport system permease protein
MTQALSSQSLARSPTVALAGRSAWAQRLPLSALGTLFWLTLRQHSRGRRLLVFAFLFLLPVGIVVLIRTFDPLLAGYHQRLAVLPALSPSASPLMIGLVYVSGWLRRLHEFEFALIFTLIPHVLVPLTALVYASSMIHDELEEQTLTYLLIRPSPKWIIYVAKLLATLLITLLLAAGFTLVTYGTMLWGSPYLGGELFWTHALKAMSLLALALTAYGALFGCLGLLVRRSLVIGVAYIVLFEGVLANIDFMVRRLTVMYYFRVLAGRWLPLNTREWSLDLTTAPSATYCVWTLLAVSLVTTVLAAWMFTTHEFRVKTPEGS